MPLRGERAGLVETTGFLQGLTYKRYEADARRIASASIQLTPDVVCVSVVPSPNSSHCNQVRYESLSVIPYFGGELVG